MAPWGICSNPFTSPQHSGGHLDALDAINVLIRTFGAGGCPNNSFDLTLGSVRVLGRSQGRSFAEYLKYACILPLLAQMLTLD